MSRFKVGDKVRTKVLYGIEFSGRDGVVERIQPTWHLEYGLRFEGEDTLRWFAREHLEIDEEQVAVDRLNAENESYRKEAQEARALQRKFYDESVDLRKRLAQAIAERDAANQQCACVVQKYDDLRACLKALAR